MLFWGATQRGVENPFCFIPEMRDRRHRSALLTDVFLSGLGILIFHYWYKMRSFRTGWG